MTDILMNRVTLSAVAICLLFAGAFTSARGEDKAAKVPTTHYVDIAKHIELDVPLSWERKFSEDGSYHFIFTTGGKSAADAQAPEFTIAIAGPDAANDSLKSPAALAAAAKKKAPDLKFEADKDLKVDGEKAVTFTGSGKTKSGAAKAVYVVTLHAGMGYTVCFACDPATFDAELKGTQPVIDSIKWNK
jgi:hypothetical protein